MQTQQLLIIGAVALVAVIAGIFLLGGSAGSSGTFDGDLGVIGEGVERAGRLPALTLPEPCVPIERGEIVPDPCGIPAGSQDHFFMFGRFEHRHVASNEPALSGEQLARVDCMTKGPLGPLRQFIVLVCHDGWQVPIPGWVEPHVAFSSLFKTVHKRMGY